MTFLPILCISLVLLVFKVYSQNEPIDLNVSDKGNALTNVGLPIRFSRSLTTNPGKNVHESNDVTSDRKKLTIMGWTGSWIWNIFGEPVTYFISRNFSPIPLCNDIFQVFDVLEEPSACTMYNGTSALSNHANIFDMFVYSVRYGICQLTEQTRQILSYMLTQIWDLLKSYVLPWLDERLMALAASGTLPPNIVTIIHTYDTMYRISHLLGYI